ncbi:MAG: YceI family protein [Erythrobacter sp.]
MIWARSLLVLLAAALLGAATPGERLYTVDGGASSLSAKVPFLGIGSKSAGFPSVAGTIRLDSRRPQDIALDVTINARALTAPDRLTLNRLKSENFFWVERYPTVRFVGREMALTSPTSGTVKGELTARGVSRPVTLQVTFDRAPATALPGEAITLTGATKINRYDFGMKSYGLIVGKWVNIQLKARMVPQA